MAATDEKAIHEFPTGTIDDNSLLIMDRPTSTPGEYETEKFAIANLGLKLLGGIDFPSNLDTDEQDIFGAINEVNAKAMNIAAEYDETASYSKGDYCIYQNAAYRCIKASGTTTGTFVTADWTQIKVLSEVKANTEEIGLKQNATDNTLTTADKTIVGAINEQQSVIGYSYDEYDATTAYSTGDMCIYNNVLYKAKQATTGNLPTNTTYWEPTSIATALKSITLNSNPATGDYHFDLAAGWSVTNFVFNRVGNIIYLQGVFVKTSAFNPYEVFVSLSSSSTKNINPYYETWFATMCDDGNGSHVSCERLQAVYNSLRIASSNSNHRRIFVCASWIAQTDVV